MLRDSLTILLATSTIACAHAALATDAAVVVSDSSSIVVTARRDDAADVSGTYIFAGKLVDIALLGDVPPIPQRNLRLAFAEIPGLLVSEVSNGSWASISYRGLGEPHESWNILSLKDAVPTVPDMYSYPAAYYVPPLELVERIEFLRGGSGLLFGPQPGGVLNYATRGPRRDAGADGLIKIGYGSFDALTALGNVTASNSRAGFDAYVHHNRGDGPRRANSDGEQSSARARAYLTGDRLTATLAFDFYRGDFGEPGGLSAARLAADNRDFSTSRDRLKIRRAVPSLAIDWEVGDATRITARAWYSRYERTSLRQAGGGFGLSTPDANVLIRQTQTFDTAALDTRVRHDFGAGARHSVTFGVFAHTSSAPVTVDKGLTNADASGGGGALARTRRSGDAVAVFGELKLGFGDLQLVPGFRLERLRQRVVEDYDNAIGSVVGGPPGAQNGTLGNRRNVETIPLWGLGVTWDASDAVRFVGNASRGFKPKLYNDGVTFQAGVDAAGEFAASYAVTVEAGVQARPMPFARLDASVFRVSFDDQIGFLAGPLPAAPPFGAIGIGGARRQNVGSMRNQGIDLSASLDLLGPRGIGAATDVLRLQGNLQLLDARFTSGAAAGFRPQYAPKALVRTSLSYIAKAGGRAAVTLTHVGRQQGSDNNAAEFMLAPYTIADASVEWPVGQMLSIGASVSNMFNERYAGRVRPGGGGGFDPGAPRTAYAGLTARF